MSLVVALFRYLDHSQSRLLNSSAIQGCSPIKYHTAPLSTITPLNYHSPSRQSCQVPTCPCPAYSFVLVIIISCPLSIIFTTQVLVLSFEIKVHLVQQ
ncbi:hypothetical protein PCASD_00315 [Puccinia coronata f. sp. avenae]|uniref:Uncharacterized protein n=1 Tax=Puccinia coronata f. sp. avenae TaxID=200324 RepID=A0A2N5VNI7_9BASI|nr:hypothetical protein PCASD_00315 [Puccinia coronata f. sp. avenae]